MERIVIPGVILVTLCILTVCVVCCSDGMAFHALDVPCYETERYRVCFALDWKGDRMIFAEDRRTGRRVRLSPEEPGHGQIPACIYGCGERVYYMELTEDYGFFSRQYSKMEIKGVNLEDFSRQTVLELRRDGRAPDSFSFPAGREELAEYSRVTAFFINVQSVYFVLPDAILRVNRWTGRRETVYPICNDRVCFPETR